MLIFITCIFGLLEISRALLSDVHNVCISENDTLKCICKNKENITIAPVTNFNIRWITVQGCGTVVVPLSAIPHLQLQEFVFADIEELTIRPFALMGVQTLHTLKIENIRKLIVKPHGFVGLLNVTNVIIKNVFSDTLMVASFGGVSTIEKFHMQNSSFGKVEANAFMFTNVTTFLIENCKFDVFESNAFLIHVADEVIFKECYIKITNNQSVCLTFVNSLSLLDSNFGILVYNSISTRNLERLTIRGCTVSVIQTYALALIDANKEIIFINNTIEVAEEYSLYISSENSTTDDVNIYLCCNYFTCDCNIHWIWEYNEEPFYRELYNTSSCLGMKANLSSMVPIMDKYENCVTLENKIYQKTYEKKYQKNFARRLQSEMRFAFFLILLTHFIFMLMF